jgi:hypothetical protein
MAAEASLADKAFVADERVIEPLLARGKSVVMPPRSHRKIHLHFDNDAYKARHLIENFFCKLKQYRHRHPLDKTARNFFAAINLAAADLPLNFHPAAIRVSGFCTPSGAGGATGDRRSWSGLRSRSPVAVNVAA